MAEPKYNRERRKQWASEQSALFVCHMPGSVRRAEGRARNMHPKKVLFHELPELHSQTDKSVVCVFIYGNVGECVVDDNWTGSTKGLSSFSDR